MRSMYVMTDGKGVVGPKAGRLRQHVRHVGGRARGFVSVGGMTEQRGLMWKERACETQKLALSHSEGNGQCRRTAGGALYPAYTH